MAMKNATVLRRVILVFMRQVKEFPQCLFQCQALAFQKHCDGAPHVLQGFHVGWIWSPSWHLTMAARTDVAYVESCFCAAIKSTGIVGYLDGISQQFAAGVFEDSVDFGL